MTVLEKFRRIYLVLRELEMPRWTDRERNGLMNELRDQIELVWMTGELHLEKATVEREVAWGLHFFDETLFEMLPETLETLEETLAEAYPGTEFKVPPFFQFGSWIGGDRDGNPYVTAAVTRQTLHRNALASLTRYQDGVRELGPDPVAHRARAAAAGGLPRRNSTGSSPRAGRPGRSPGAIPASPIASICPASCARSRRRSRATRASTRPAPITPAPTG